MLQVEVYITVRFFRQKIATTLCAYERPTRSQLPVGPIMGLSVRTIVSSSYTVSCFPVLFGDNGIRFFSYPLPSIASFDFTVILLCTQMTKGLPSSASYRYDEVRWVLYSGQGTGRVTAAL